MRCSSCGSPLERPGDLCLVCGETNVEAAAVLFGEDGAEIRFYSGDEAAAESVPSSYGRDSGEERRVAFRNHVSRVEDLIYRRRPGTVYAGGDRESVRELKASTSLPMERVESFEEARSRLSEGAPLERVEASPEDKFGGSHTSVIGGSRGMGLLVKLAGHPNVKKVVPAVISAKGTRGGGGTRLSVTRVDDRGNLKALLKSGSSVQEVRVVTTASSREEGRRVASDLEGED